MFKVGDRVFFRTVTYHTVGEIVEIDGQWVRLKDASWVADSGRFTQAIRDGKLSEVEPTGDCYLNLSTVVDAFPWKHELPSKQI